MTYLGVTPALQEEFMRVEVESIQQQPMLAMALASCVSGSMAAIITQPFDTIKTRMQANVDVMIYR